MDYSARLIRLEKRLDDLSCHALLIENPVDLLYLTGLELSSGKLLIGKNSTTLFVDGRYIEHCQKNSPCSAVLYKESEFIERISLLGTLGFDSVYTSYQNFLNMKKWGSVRLIPLESPVSPLREIKDADEITLLRQAAQLDVQGFLFAQSFLKEGISEFEVALELELFWKKRGGRKVGFDPIIAFGPNTAMPHYRAGNAKLKYGMPVLIDIGVTFHHYQSDMTRVVFFGPADPKLQEIYTIVDEAKQKAMALCRPGAKVGDLDAAARDHIAAKGYGDNFSHSLGHGVGLEVHESPTLRNRPPYSEKVLSPGFVITIEPGIYLPGLGGVRLEDTLVITPTGYEILTVN